MERLHLFNANPAELAKLAASAAAMRSTPLRDVRRRLRDCQHRPRCDGEQLADRLRELPVTERLRLSLVITELIVEILLAADAYVSERMAARLSMRKSGGVA